VRGLSCAANGLRVLERSAGLQIGRDARRAKSVTSDLDAHAEIGGAALNRAPRVDAVHRRLGQRASTADGGAEEGAFALIAYAGRLDVGVEMAPSV
jgi:hypothetical protein